jgi:hypothetical protein
MWRERRFDDARHTRPAAAGKAKKLHLVAGEICAEFNLRVFIFNGKIGICAP